MRLDEIRRSPVFLLAFALVAGCAGKSPAEVEAERAKANAEWDAQAAGAERERQAEEDKLVEEEMAAHRRREQVDEEHEDKADLAQQDAERDRLTSLVLAQFPDPQSAHLSDLRWTTGNTAVCGTVSARGADGRWSQPVAFVVKGEQATIDSAEADRHVQYLEAAQVTGCAP